MNNNIISKYSLYSTKYIDELSQNKGLRLDVIEFYKKEFADIHRLNSLYCSNKTIAINPAVPLYFAKYFSLDI